YGAEGKYKGLKKREIPQDIYKIEITSYLWKVMTFKEASKKYDVAVSTLRHRASDRRFQEGDIRKSGDTWLVTKSAMDRIYG
ncbi:MAG: helix-turn-helix domain-containing protein, partial [Halanaerobium sp.]